MNANQAMAAGETTVDSIVYRGLRHRVLPGYVTQTACGIGFLHPPKSTRAERDCPACWRPVKQEAGPIG